MPETTTWYLATEYSDTIATREVKKETRLYVYIGRYRYPKNGGGDHYFKTLEQAAEWLREHVDEKVSAAEASLRRSKDSLRRSKDKRDRVYAAYPPPAATDTEGAK